jgi:CrcB protein
VGGLPILPHLWSLLLPNVSGFLSVNHILFVGLGGFAGAICRFLLSGAVQRLVPAAVVPWGTLVVNILGCALIGALAAIGESRAIFSDSVRLFLLTGLLGGFTTFSAFALETMSLVRNDHGLQALAHVGLHMVLCLAAVAVGDALTRMLAR